MTLEYRGVTYSMDRGEQSEVWRWRVMVGRPEMLRIGEAATEHQANLQVRSVIDRALALQEKLGSPPSRSPHEQRG